MKSKNDTFASLFEGLAYRYDLRAVFEDFLTIALCAFGRNHATGLSYDEDLYLATIAKYVQEDANELFPKMLALLIVEMENRTDSPTGNDVLGEFYEASFCRKGAGQFFTPWHICELMSSFQSEKDLERHRPLRIIDPSCGSGRMLLAGARRLGKSERYFGIDIDHTCVKMAAINLFLNGIFHAEVMCADALSPNDFRMSYRTSFLPFGVYRNENKEDSPLWHAHNAAFDQKKKAEVAWPENPFKTNDGGSQLQLF